MTRSCSSNHRSLAAVLASLLATGCGLAAGLQPADTVPAEESGDMTDAVEQPEAAGEPVAAVEPRTFGQLVVDVLSGQGYGCTATDVAGRWRCVGAGQTRGTYVWSVEEPATLHFSSYQHRAFGRRCVQFVDAAKDLEVKGYYVVSCDDSLQMFEFSTAVRYAAGIDVMEWIHYHEAQRANSVALLDSIQALRD